MTRKAPSLKRPLILQPLIFQLIVLLVCCMAIMAAAVRSDVGGLYTDETIAPVIARAVVRRPDGGLAIRPTSEFTELRAETPDLWFVAEDDDGKHVTYGEVPAPFASLVGVLKHVSYAHLRDRTPPYRMSAVIRREEGPAGELTILGHGKLTGLTMIVLLASNVVIVPIFILLALVSFLVTPWIVRRSLAGVRRIAAEAEQIDPDRRGWRLSEEQVPAEIGPLVRAVNDALGRLDEGYERQRRFIASAAHELRTPIAILRVKVEAAEKDAARRLLADVDRLANLAEQLLDLQRLEIDRSDDAIELPALVRGVVADLAPLLITANRTIEVAIENARTVHGDAGAIGRVLTNLIQNAVEHGGQNLAVRVTGSTFEVEDDGPGIPAEERERVFEPFHRLRPRSAGTGLGLHLVQQVVERHGGHVAIMSAAGGGTIVRVSFPDR